MAPINITNFPNALGQQTGMTTVAAGIFLSMFFVAVFVIAIAWISESILATALTGFLVLFFLTAVGWVPPFVDVFFIVIAAIILAADWSGILTGKGGNL